MDNGIFIYDIIFYFWANSVDMNKKFGEERERFPAGFKLQTGDIVII